MAKLLLRSTATNRGNKFEGDPVAVEENTHVFGEREDIRVWQANPANDGVPFPGQFYVIEIPDMPVSIGRRIFQPWVRPATVLDVEFTAPDPEDRMVLLGPYRWQFGVADKLPGPVRQALRQDGYLENVAYDIPTINNYMVDRAGLDTFVPGAGGPIDPQPPGA